MTQERKVPETRRLMEDKSFQDWLVEMGIMTIVNIEDVDLPNLDIMPRFGPAQRTTWTRLRLNKNRLVTDLELASAWIPDIDIDFAKVYARDTVSRLRKRLTNPSLIFTADGLGHGIGIVSMSLDRQTARTCYRLWQDLGQPVSRIELAAVLYNVAVDNVELRMFNDVRVNIDRLRKNISNSQAEVQSYPLIPRLHYQLQEQ